jgi:hypothetical protein
MVKNGIIITINGHFKEVIPMKKLLLYMALLMPAFSIHAMDEEKQGFSAIFEPMEKFSGIVLRSFASASANMLDYTQNATDDTNNNNNTTAADTTKNDDSTVHGEDEKESKSNNNNNSFKSWHEITSQEVKYAQLSNDAAAKLLEVRNLLPKELQGSICQNLLKADKPEEELTKAREILWNCLTRTDSDYVASYIRTVAKNFAPCNFDYKNVYRHLGFKTSEEGMAIDNETCAKLVAANLEHALKTNNEKETFLMRQFGFIFRNEFTKKTFDIYLKDGEAGLEKLKLSQNVGEELQGKHDELVEAAYNLAKANSKK